MSDDDEYMGEDDVAEGNDTCRSKACGQALSRPSLPRPQQKDQRWPAAA
jgi:hypothetical protein